MSRTQLHPRTKKKNKRKEKPRRVFNDDSQSADGYFYNTIHKDLQQKYVYTFYCRVKIILVLLECLI